MSKRYDAMFTRLKQDNEVAWIPFVMLGYPTLELSERYIHALIDSGADALELGLPFSDPVADGPVIQEAARVALEQDTHIKDCIAVVQRVREAHPDVPMGLLVYANLLFRPGITEMYQQLAAAGIDSVLVADLPVREAVRFAEPALTVGIDPVFIAPPNASDRSLIELAQHCRGYTYVVSRPGVTGNHQDVAYPLEVLAKLREHQAPPAVLGFGISKPEHVSAAVKAGFDGVIAGTAVIKIMLEKGADAEADLRSFSQQMKAACRSTSA